MAPLPSYSYCMPPLHLCTLAVWTHFPSCLVAVWTHFPSCLVAVWTHFPSCLVAVWTHFPSCHVAIWTHFPSCLVAVWTHFPSCLVAFWTHSPSLVAIWTHSLHVLLLYGPTPPILLLYGPTPPHILLLYPPLPWCFVAIWTHSPSCCYMTHSPYVLLLHGSIPHVYSYRMKPIPSQEALLYFVIGPYIIFSTPSPSQFKFWSSLAPTTPDLKVTPLKSKHFI